MSKPAVLQPPTSPWHTGIRTSAVVSSHRDQHDTKTDAAWLSKPANKRLVSQAQGRLLRLVVPRNCWEGAKSRVKHLTSSSCLTYIRLLGGFLSRFSGRQKIDWRTIQYRYCHSCQGQVVACRGSLGVWLALLPIPATGYTRFSPQLPWISLTFPTLASKYGTIVIPPIDMVTLNQPDVRGLGAGHSADVTTLDTRGVVHQDGLRLGVN